MTTRIFKVWIVNNQGRVNTAMILRALSVLRWIFPSIGITVEHVKDLTNGPDAP